MIPAFTATVSTLTVSDRHEKNKALREWLGLAAHGDVHAFERVYLATCRWMLSRVRGLVGDSLAEDVLSDVYLQLWRTLGTYDPARGEPLSWLMTIARSRALDRLRTERYSHGGEQYALSAHQVQTEPTHDDGPEQLLELAQLRKSAQACMSSLSPKERLVVGLAYFYDFSHSEISTRTGLPLGSVKTLISRSQIKLRARLQQAPDMVQSVVHHTAKPMMSAAS
jgi:RNA polymerase sigma-70 factor (ECF subfamily)